MPRPSQSRPRVDLLGPVQVTVDGAVVGVRGLKQQVLLSRLALAGGKPVSVDSLVDDLWAQDPPADAGGALQVHVSRLRSALAVGIELVGGSAYRLATDQFHTDVREFLAHCDRARTAMAGGNGAAAADGFESALQLWRGPALGELGRDNALRAAALRLDEGRDRAVDAWVEACLEVGRAADVVDELRTGLERDPLQEHRWRLLILALHRSGRHGDALAAHRQAREVFIEELGVEPSRMLSDVHAELQRLDAPAAPAGPTPADPTPANLKATGPTPEDLAASGLIGRADEFAILTEAWRDAHDGLRVVTLSGEPGVGKSRLAAEFSERAAAAGATVLAGRCDQSITSPFQPFAQILGAHFETLLSRREAGPVDARLPRHLPGLVRVAPELTGVLPTESGRAATPPDDRGHGAYEAVAAWLEVISGSAPVLLVLDDLHWADSETLHQLRHLLHSPRPIHALIVVAMRDREISAPQPAGHVAATLFPALLRQSAQVSHLPLRRLDRHETATLLTHESAATDPPPRAVVDHVSAASGGNPLFIVELARQLRTSSVSAAAVSSSTGLSPSSPDLGVTPGLRQVIGDRVAVLPRATGAVLRRAAVVGAEFDAAVVAGLGDDDDTTVNSVDGVHAAAADAVHAQLIEPIGGSERYTFSHEIVRRTLYESLPPGERAGLHGAIAEILAGEAVRDPAAHHHMVAHHLRRSDLPDGSGRAARHLLAAGRDALERGAAVNALHLLQEALDLTSLDDTLRCDLLTELGRAQTRSAHPDHRRTLIEAAALAHRLGDRDRLIAAVLANNRGWFSDTTAIDHDRVAGIETALAMCGPDDPGARAPLLAAWATENSRDPGVRDKALAASAEAVELARHLGDDTTLTLALDRRYTVLYALFEQPVECLRLAEHLMDLARASGDKSARLSASICLAQASMRFGGYHVADRHMQQAAQLARALEQPSRLWLVESWRATREGMRGRLDRAEELIRENLALGQRTDQGDALTWFTGQLFTIRLLQGRLPEMLADVTDQVATAAEAIPAWRAAMAMVLAQSGGAADAEAVLEELASDSFSALPRDVVWINGMSYLSMVCETVGRADLAGDLYRALAPYSGMVATNGTIDSGPVDLRLGALAGLLGDTELARQHLASAESLCRRIDAPVWGAHATRLLRAL